MRSASRRYVVHGAAELEPERRRLAKELLFIL